MSEPITRSEMYLAALNGEAVTPPAPITRMDMYLAYLNGMTDTYPEPITRTEQYLYKLCQNGMGGGGGVTIRNQNKTITENGEYTADAGYTGLGKVTVDVEADGGGGSMSALLEGSLTEIIDTQATAIRQAALRDYPTLQRVECTAVKTIYGFSLRDNKALTSVRFPALITLSGSDQFTNCSALTDVYMPLVESIPDFCFFKCTKLQSIILPRVTTLNSSCFSTCTTLNTVVLKNNSVCTLAAVGAFASTPFASGGTGGTVYVPAALISAYQTATNWSTLYAAGTCNFVAIEGSEYE